MNQGTVDYDKNTAIITISTNNSNALTGKKESVRTSLSSQGVDIVGMKTEDSKIHKCVMLVYAQDPKKLQKALSEVNRTKLLRTESKSSIEVITNKDDKEDLSKKYFRSDVNEAVDEHLYNKYWD